MGTSVSSIVHVRRVPQLINIDTTYPVCTTACHVWHSSDFNEIQISMATHPFAHANTRAPLPPFALVSACVCVFCQWLLSWCFLAPIIIEMRYFFANKAVFNSSSFA